MRALLRLSATLACTCAAPAFAQIDIGAGSTFDFGNAAIDFGCSDLNLAGNATAAAGAFTGLRHLTIVAGGDFQLREVDGAAVEPARGAGLEAGQLEPALG